MLQSHRSSYSTLALPCGKEEESGSSGGYACHQALLTRIMSWGRLQGTGAIVTVENTAFMEEALAAAV